MNILYTVNDKFVPQVGSGICSICENNKNFDEIKFYILSEKISKENKNHLENFVKTYNREIIIIELENVHKYFDFDFKTTGWSQIIVARLLMAKLLPQEIDKILYLDGDTIVRGNLSELWNMDMKNKTIGASIEPTINNKRKRKLNLYSKLYYNSGVLLIDLKRWRRQKVGEKIIKYYKDNDGVLFAPDQDAINGAVNDEIITISPKYNFYNIFNQYSYRFLKKLVKPAEYISKEMFEDAVEKPVIIHYLGEERPWRKGNTHRYKDDYKYYLSLTPWKNTGDEVGWEKYFICWKIFNIITKPFPRIRYNIITLLIPVFLKYRGKKK